MSQIENASKGRVKFADKTDRHAFLFKLAS